MQVPFEIRNNAWFDTPQIYEIEVTHDLAGSPQKQVLHEQNISQVDKTELRSIVISCFQFAVETPDAKMERYPSFPGTVIRLRTIASLSGTKSQQASFT